MKNRNTLYVFITLFVLAVFSRWMGHAWNFTLVGGAFLFAGAYFQDKKVAVALMSETLISVLMALVAPLERPCMAGKIPVLRE